MVESFTTESLSEKNKVILHLVIGNTVAYKNKIRRDCPLRVSASCVPCTQTQDGR